MIGRFIAQLILTTSLLNILPQDGSALEAAAGLPIAPDYSVATLALQLVSSDTGFPLSTENGPTKIDSLSLGMVTSAQSVLVMDAQSGAVLYEKNPQEHRAIGSITKLMTAVVFLETQPDLTTSVQLIETDIREGGRTYLALDDAVSLGDVLAASLIGSDNSATVALVRLSGLTEADFLAAMNEKAAAFGMNDTVFFDPTGLSSKNRSTTFDLTKLLAAARERMEIQRLTTTAQTTVTQASGRSVTIDSTDDLLTSFVNEPPFGMLVGKTGYLPEAGYCIALAVQKEGGGNVYVILLGSDSLISRVQEVKGLVDWVYRVWDWN